MTSTVTAITITIITTTMTDRQSLLRLMTWLSPAFPVGGFAYSGGLEAAAREGHVSDAAELREWLESALSCGQFHSDAVLLTEAWNARGNVVRLAAVADLSRALAGSAERFLEMTAQGEAFLEAASPWLPEALRTLGGQPAHAVAVGAVASASQVGLQDTLTAWLHAATSQSISAAIRLGVLGQRQAVLLLAELEPAILDAVQRVENSTLDDLGSGTIIIDIMSARHEQTHSRLFRS